MCSFENLTETLKNVVKEKSELFSLLNKEIEKNTELINYIKILENDCLIIRKENDFLRKNKIIENKKNEFQVVTENDLNSINKNNQLLIEYKDSQTFFSRIKNKNFLNFLKLS